MNKKLISLCISFFMLFSPSALRAKDAAATRCPEASFAVQILGSGGPELNDGRASSSYLLWIDGRAIALIDLGSGSLRNLERTAARIEKIDAVFFTHLHVDHSSDLPAFIKGNYFVRRTKDLFIYGPNGNRYLPATDLFVERLFGNDGVYPYLNDYLSGQAEFSIRATALPSAKDGRVHLTIGDKKLTATAQPVNHGPLPALAWRFDFEEHSLTLSGDTSAKTDRLIELAKNSDLLIAHNAVPENANPIAKNLHMPPSRVGEVAAQAKVKHLVLSHRMRRTLGKEAETEKQIRENYSGKIDFAEDMQCFQISD